MAGLPAETDPAPDIEIGESDTMAFPLRKPGGEDEGPRPPLAAAPGVVIADKYRVVRVIGQGGMGIVLEARHEALDARVAIKVLLSELMAYTEAAERFTREARAVARLRSQHVARVLDVGALSSGEPYMVMELLEGQDLGSLLDVEEKLPIADAIDAIVQACDALADAHARGIVHRDLKPANLFVTRKDGSSLVKLLDFGVSKVLGEGSGDVGLTRTTMILGSALYMSPEQMRSAKTVDHRTDIYAIGACLFEMIGGRPPYQADSFPELCAMVFTSPPAPLRELRPDVPSGLVRVLERSLARAPADRPQSVAELVQSLAPYAREDTRARIADILRQHAPELELPPPASPSIRPPAEERPAEPALALAPRSRRRGALLLLAFTAAAGLGAVGLLRLRPPASQPTTPPKAASAAVADAPAPVDQPVALQSTEAAPVVSAASSAASAASAPAFAGVDAGAADAAIDGSSADAQAKAAATRKPQGVPSGPSAAPATGPGRAESGWGRPGPALLPEAIEKTPPPPVNKELIQETCTEILPDGTRRQVPCN